MTVELDELSENVTAHVRDALLGWRDGDIVVTEGYTAGTYKVVYRPGTEDRAAREADNVAEADVTRAAERLMVQDYLSWREGKGDTNFDVGVAGFELINGFMTIWGKSLQVGMVTVDSNGAEYFTMWVRNSHTLYVGVDKNDYVSVYTGKGRRTELMSARSAGTKKLRFILNGENIDITYDMLDKFRV